MNRHPEQSEGPPYSTPAAAASHPHHRLAAHGRIGSLHLSFEAGLTAPWTVLFGPSGCGKSTLLRAICGLTDLAVDLQRRTGDRWSTLQDATENAPPERRQLAYAPQNAALFPHLTVLENVAFSSSVRRRTSSVTQPQTSCHPERSEGPAFASSPPDLVRQAIDLLQIRPLAARLPRHLSGGERQRVALARALAVPDTQLILLDEPFSGIDRTLRDQLLPEVQSWLAQRNIPALSVTHDVDEPLLLQAEVIRLHEGQNTAQGPAREVLAAETARLLRVLESKGHATPDARDTSTLTDIDARTSPPTHTGR